MKWSDAKKAHYFPWKFNEVEVKALKKRDSSRVTLAHLTLHFTSDYLERHERECSFYSMHVHFITTHSHLKLE